MGETTKLGNDRGGGARIVQTRVDQNRTFRFFPGLIAGPTPFWKQPFCQPHNKLAKNGHRTTVPLTR